MQIVLPASRWIPVPGSEIHVKMLVDRAGDAEDRAARRRRAGRLLAEHRLRAGLTQEALADKLATDRPTITRNDVSRWERGGRAPGAYWLPRLTGLLGLPENALTSILLPAERRPPLPRLAVCGTETGTTTAYVVDLPFGAWTPVPRCSWIARPRSASSALLDSQTPGPATRWRYDDQI